MNLANKLTISRIVLAFVFLFFLFSKGLFAKTLALCTFITASVTDALDGFIAKSTNNITDFGKLMDPIADKVLVLVAFLAFVEMKLIPAWMVVIIILREFVVTSLRMLALSKGKVIASSDDGKQKTVSQYVVIFFILLFLVFKELGVKVFNLWGPKAEVVLKDSIFVLMIIAVTLTVISGVSYLIKNKEIYLNAKVR